MTVVISTGKCFIPRSANIYIIIYHYVTLTSYVTLKKKIDKDGLYHVTVKRHDLHGIMKNNFCVHPCFLSRTAR